MLRNFCFADRLLVPLHLNKIEDSLQLDDAINLLNNPLSRFSHKVKRFLNQYPVCVKEAIQCRFQFFAANVWG